MLFIGCSGKWNTDGCTYVPDLFLNYEACVMHDLCYVTPGVTKVRESCIHFHIAVSLHHNGLVSWDLHCLTTEVFCNVVPLIVSLYIYDMKTLYWGLPNISGNLRRSENMTGILVRRFPMYSSSVGIVWKSHQKISSRSISQEEGKN
jgi:hypothetical protein